MAEKAERSSDHYGLEPKFERAVVALLVRSQRFFGRIGIELHPDGLVHASGKLLLEAAQAIARDAGHGPAAPVIVLQRLRRMMEDGKVTIEQLRAASEYLDEAEDAGLPAEDAVAEELSPILKRRLQASAVRTAMDEYTKRGNFARVSEIINKAASIGTLDLSIGSRIGAHSTIEIDELRRLNKLSTGLPELDLEMDGGLWRGAFGICVGATGGGKSMFLSHQAARAWLGGMHVVYATLELPRPMIVARILANVTGLSINTLMDGGANDDVKKRIDDLHGQLGDCIVKEFTPGLTTVEDLRKWVTECEDQAGRAVDLICTDYMDRMGVANAPKDTGDYKAGKIIAEGLRNFAVEKKHWSWSASAAKGDSGKKKKKIDTDDLADSMHKSRTADLVLTANNRDDGQILWNIAKNRMGRSHVSVTLPHDFAFGRIGVLLEGQTRP